MHTGYDNEPDGTVPLEAGEIIYKLGYRAGEACGYKRALAALKKKDAIRRALDFSSSEPCRCS